MASGRRIALVTAVSSLLLVVGWQASADLRGHAAPRLRAPQWAADFLSGTQVLGAVAGWKVVSESSSRAAGSRRAGASDTTQEEWPRESPLILLLLGSCFALIARGLRRSRR